MATNTDTNGPAVILYGHAACPQVPPVRGLLGRAGVPYDYVNIRQDADAAARVRAINGGNESVPTLVFADGGTLTEPSVAELVARLESLGYGVGWGARLLGHGWKIIVALGVAFALVRAVGWL